jgi:hypothetical protein
LLEPSGPAARTWVGSIDHIWSSTSFDDGTGHVATAAGDSSVFTDTASTYNVLVQAGSGTGPVVGGIQFSGATSYTFTASGGTITLSTGTGGGVSVADLSTAANHTINAPISLNGPLALTGRGRRSNRLARRTGQL